MDSLEQISTLLATSLDAVIQRAVAQAVKPLQQEIALLREMTDEYINSAQAMRIIGCSRATLEKERKRPDTLLVTSYLESKPTYSRVSAFAVKEARTLRKYNTSR